MMEADDTIDDLIFKGDDKKLVKIPRGGAGLLKTLKQFVAHQQYQGMSFGSADWTNITKDQFDNFRISNSNNLASITVASAPAPSAPKSALSNDLVRDFK